MAGVSYTHQLHTAKDEARDVPVLTKHRTRRERTRGRKRKTSHKKTEPHAKY